MNKTLYESINDTMNYIYNNDLIDNVAKRWCLFGIYLTYGNIFCDTNNLSRSEHHNLSECYKEMMHKLND